LDAPGFAILRGKFSTIRQRDWFVPKIWIFSVQFLPQQTIGSTMGRASISLVIYDCPQKGQ
jgi:hypothetical protein